MNAPRVDTQTVVVLSVDEVSAVLACIDNERERISAAREWDTTSYPAKALRTARRKLNGSLTGLQDGV